MRLAPCAAALALVALDARIAGAVGEDERQLAATAGVGWLEGAGPAWRLEGQYGLSDVLAAHATAGASWHARTGPTVRAVALSAGVTYAFDVVRTVPFLEVALTFLDQGAGASRRDLGVEGGVGVEYLADRRWSVALVGRAAYLPLRLGGSGGPRPALLGLGLRLGRTF